MKRKIGIALLTFAMFLTACGSSKDIDYYETLDPKQTQLLSMDTINYSQYNYELDLYGKHYK